MKSLIHSLVTACMLTAGVVSATAQAQLSVGTDRQLTVFQLSLPKTRFTDETSPYAPLDEWAVEAIGGAARELYLTHDGEGARVSVYGLVDNTQPLTLSIFPVAGVSMSRPMFAIEIDFDEAMLADGSTLLSQWATARRWALLPYPVDESAGGLLRPMLLRSAQLYSPDTSAGALFPGLERRAATRRTTNGFSLFSGEAAIEETLQQQLIATGQRRSHELTHDVGVLRGPEVRSHPFTAMLAGRTVVTPSIASLVPPERYFVHIDDIGAALGWLDKTAATGFELIGLKLGTHVSHDLVDRYLARLNFSRPLVRKLADAGLVGEMALFGPDLYLQHGSELTVILDTDDSLISDLLLAPLLGSVLGKGQGEVVAYGPADGPPAYFTRHAQWLIFSTSRAEASAAVTLAKSGGAGSLGQSDEFQYMISLLPEPDAANGLFVYLSDPFIRSMVGPDIKIRQLRRHEARARLSMVAAGSALHRVDHGEAADLDTLLALGYVESDWLSSPEGDEISLDEARIPQSSLYGSLDDMTPLTRLALNQITDAERAGYESYVTQYSRYWSRFFDPIGIRVAMTEPLSVETIILPLVENSIYGLIRELIGGEPVELNVPNYTPQPVTSISLKRPPAEFLKPLEGLSYLGPLEEVLGDGIHVALYDSSPLIGLGSTDLIGGFSGGWLSGGGDWLLWGGLAASMLTQPTAVFLELNPTFSASGKVEAFLHGALFQWFRWEEGQHRLDSIGEQEWVFTWSFEGLVRLHAYMSIVDEYLVVSNHRLSLTPAPEDVKPSRGNAAVRIRFDEIEQLEQLLGLHQLQHAQSSAFKSAERLRPFFVLGATDVEEALEAHEALYGTRPLPPAGSEWQWNRRSRRLDNNRFGNPFHSRLPSNWSGATNASGGSPFEGLSKLSLDFRFEEDGVRTILRVE